jgi:UDP-glucose 4-epimerase
VYGLSKALAEDVVRHFAAGGPSAVIARLFNAYGPYETNPHLIPHIVESLRVNPREVPLGNTETQRDYVHVTDIAEGLLALSNPRLAGGGVYNIGTGRQYSAADIVTLLGELRGLPISIAHDISRKRAVDKPFQRAGTEKIVRECGWRARVELREGLLELLKHEGLLNDR